MIHIMASGVNQMYHEAIHTLHAHFMGSRTIMEETRNGPVVRFATPVMFEYYNPRTCVLFNKHRDANPFFHLMESIWMLAGDNRAEWLSQFSSNIGNYAEDNGKFWGAYGYRWREVFMVDQIEEVVYQLKHEPNSRRVVMAMWDPNLDLGTKKKDLPCNTHIYFQMVFGALDMTVCNRSNDMIWGALGANAVHFSVLQQFLAAAIGVPVGKYWHFSNNMHLYVNTHQSILHDPIKNSCETVMRPYPIVWPLYDSRFDLGKNLYDMSYFVEKAGSEGYEPENPFLKQIALPMYQFYVGRKAGNVDYDLLKNMPECDWKVAAIEWAMRRDGEGVCQPTTDK